MRVLKLNASYEYLGVSPWWKCMRLILSGRAEVVAEYPNKFISSENQSMPMPAVIIMKEYIKTKTRKRSFTATTKNILIRDNFTCQYCGVKLNKKNGTKDHVHPESKGGPTSMGNLVASCMSCNNKKDDRTCKESGMYPMNQPRDLTEEEKLQTVLKTYKTIEKKTWFKYLNARNIKLW